MEIINRTANFRSDMCQKVYASGRICSLNRNELTTLLESFMELMKSNSNKLSLDDLKKAVSVVIERNIAKARILRKEQNAGYILISGITCIGTLVVAAIIFMTVKFIVLG